MFVSKERGRINLTVREVQKKIHVTGKSAISQIPEIQTLKNGVIIVRRMGNV